MSTPMTAKPFTTRLDAPLKMRLDALARKEDRSASYLAKRAIRLFVEQREQEYARIEQARAEIAGKQGIAEEHIDRWMQRWAEGEDAPFPSNSDV